MVRMLAAKGYCLISYILFLGFVVPAIALIEPFWRIRIGVLKEDRIAHLAMNTDNFIRRLKLYGKPSRTTYYFLCWQPANRQLVIMWKRVLNILENRWLRRASLCVMPAFRKMWFFQSLDSLETEHYEYSFGEVTLSFTPEEEARGKAALAEMGIGPDDWFICFHNRTADYMAKRTGMGRQSPEPSFRDCSIDNYLPAAQWIAAQGGYALRFGSIVEKSLPDLGPRIIDYASKYRNDFMDIYLLAKCRFFLGSTSGPVIIPPIFNGFAGEGNHCPYESAGLGLRTLMVPKYLRRISDGKVLTFPEVFDLGLFKLHNDFTLRQRTSQGAVHEALGLDWIENDPDDLVDLCKSLMDLVTGVPIDPMAVQLQNIYARYYQGGPHASPYAGRIAHHYVLRRRDMFGRDLALLKQEMTVKS